MASTGLGESGSHSEQSKDEEVNGELETVDNKDRDDSNNNLDDTQDDNDLKPIDTNRQENPQRAKKEATKPPAVEKETDTPSFSIGTTTLKRKSEQKTRATRRTKKPTIWKCRKCGTANDIHAPRCSGPACGERNRTHLCIPWICNSCSTRNRYDDKNCRKEGCLGKKTVWGIPPNGVQRQSYQPATHTVVGVAAAPRNVGNDSLKAEDAAPKNRKRTASNMAQPVQEPAISRGRVRGERLAALPVVEGAIRRRKKRRKKKKELRDKESALLKLPGRREEHERKVAVRDTANLKLKKRKAALKIQTGFRRYLSVCLANALRQERNMMVLQRAKRGDTSSTGTSLVSRSALLSLFRFLCWKSDGRVKIIRHFSLTISLFCLTFPSWTPLHYVNVKKN